MLNKWGGLNKWGNNPYTVIVNHLQYGSKTVIDVKYFNGTELVDVELKVNGSVVWQT